MRLEEKNSLHIKKEYEKIIYSIPDKISKTELQELTGYTFNDVYLLGHLKTFRQTCIFYEDIEIALDKNEYRGKTDYELEIEFKNKYPYELVKLITDCGIDVNRYSEGKFSRFMNSINSK